MRTQLVTEDFAGKRADVVVTGLFPAISRAYIHKLFDADKITLDKSPVKPGYRLRLGETLHILFDPSELEQIADIELPVLYEDNDVLVVDKPVGVISHARGKFWNEPSVASFVRQVTQQQGERAGIVHRLDRATSGVMICAKNGEALAWLQKQFNQRKVKKVYQAVVSGIPDPAEAIIDMPIERNPAKPQTFRTGSGGRAAVTHYKTLASNGKHTLLQLEPTTGRTHQLRVHLKQIGHPIVGDALYGGEVADRLLLHAYSLEITLPSRERKKFVSFLPTKFKQVSMP